MRRLQEIDKEKHMQLSQLRRLLDSRFAVRDREDAAMLGTMRTTAIDLIKAKLLSSPHGISMELFESAFAIVVAYIESLKVSTNFSETKYSFINYQRVYQQ